MKTCLHLSLVVFSLAAALPCFAQEERPAQPPFYKIDIVVKELDGGKAVNSRAYSSLVSQTERGSIRTGNRVPVSTAPNTTSFQYFDVGINLDFKVVRELSDRLALD